MNYDNMTFSELRSYVLAHREDSEAVRALFNRRSPDETATWYPAPVDEEGVRVMEEAFKQKFGSSPKRGSSFEGGNDKPA